MSTFPHENPMCQCGVLLSRHNMEDDDHAFRLDLKAKWNRKPQCENCARALTRLMASRDEEGPSPGEMQACPDCGDRRWVVQRTGLASVGLR